MAKRAALITVESATFTPDGEGSHTPIEIEGLTAAEMEEVLVWDDAPVTDGNALPSEDDVGLETALSFVLASDDAEAMLDAATMQAGATGSLEIVGTMIDDDTYTQLTVSNTSVMVGPARRVTLPGRKGDRVAWQREFTPLAGGESDIEKTGVEEA